MSWINFQGEIVLEGETAVIFDKCKEVVKAMEAKTTHVEQRPNFIIAELDRDRIIVRLKRVRGTKHKLNILSQCKSPTVMVDGGRNRKNVNTFLNDIMPTPTTDH
jgi:hypothetical protein